MRCHYEVLGVPRTIEDGELRGVYRKMALKWHPDKNRDVDPEKAKEVFQEIQQAYEVLSDPQERAWYDSHREAILQNGGLGEGNVQIDGVDLFPFFNSSCFKGFGDDDQGFYGVYRKLFKTINEEDQAHLDEPTTYPSFGSAKDVEENWPEFYAFFAAYTTPRSYSWLDQYDTRQADNRRVSRLMEKENKKVREKAKNERNQLVRELVTFVKKRDKRIQAFNKKLEEKREQNKQKTEEMRKKHLEAQAAALKEEAERMAENGGAFGNMDDMQKELDKLADQYDSEGEDNFCVACNKQFKNEKTYNSHLKQKKHKENVELLKELLTAEEKEELNIGDLAPEEEEEAKEEVKEKSVENVSEVIAEGEEENVKDKAGAKKKGKRKKGGKKGKEEEGLDKKCQVCREAFTSKNKLFSHLKESGHAVYVGK